MPACHTGGVSLFWLCYRADQAFVGSMFIEAPSLAQARLAATVAGVDPGFDCEGFELDPRESAIVSRDLIGRLLDAEELDALQYALTPKKPAAASVRNRGKARRRA